MGGGRVSGGEWVMSVGLVSDGGLVYAYGGEWVMSDGQVSGDEWVSSCGRVSSYHYDN